MLEHLQQFAAQNQFFSGLAGASLVGGALYWARSLPSQAWEWLKWSTSFQVEVSNDTEIYPVVLTWVTEHATDSWHNRNFKLNEENSRRGEVPVGGGEETTLEWMLSPGVGRNWLFFEGRPVLVEREITNSEHASSNYVRETLKIRLFSPSRERLARLLANFKSVHEDRSTTAVYLWRTDYWRLMERRRPRDPRSIVVRGDFLDDLIADARRFMEAEAWYAARGVPYRRGYLFAGPPGTGKTSAALALAGWLKLPLYVLNLGSLATDNSLIDAMANVPPRAILLVDDLDSATIGKDAKISLAALLSTFDGAMARDGRILVVAANDPETVPAALIRPGRIDVRFDFGLSSGVEAAILYERFFPEADGDPLRANGFDPRAAAAIQADLLRYSTDPAAALSALLGRH